MKSLKKFLSILMTLIMVAGLFPTMSFAAEDGVAIDAANFPDDNFRDYITRFDKNNDGYFSDEELMNVKEIWCFNNKISDMTGIKYFTYLEQLNCQSNQLTSLDVSDCTSLISLYCDYNMLTMLNVSNNIGLQVLYCRENRLSNLDVSNCTALQTLDCSYNGLNSLDVNDCKNLTSLTCILEGLTTLDVSGCISLKTLNCADNLLTSINVSGCNELENIDCSANQLKSLNVSNNKSLTSLVCSSNKLISIDVSGCNSLKTVYCDNNQLDSFRVGDAPFLLDAVKNGIKTEYPQWKYDSYYKGGAELRIDSATRIITESLLGVAIDEDNFPDENFRSFVTLFDYNNNGFLSNVEIENITEIDCSNRNIEDLSGIDYFISLKALRCNNNYLERLDMSGCSTLCLLDCSSNQLTTLDVSNCNALTSLSCYSNQLESLDVFTTPYILDSVKNGIKTEYPEWGYVRYSNEESNILIDSTVDIIIDGYLGVAISEENFPDENFRDYVAKFDTNKDEYFSDEELEKVTEIYCSNMGISDLRGIEYFTNLKTLWC